MKVKEILKNRSRWMPSKDYNQATPVVSVLLPTWKRAKGGLFEAAVKSVLAQSFFELELIIVDDCSTDGTFDIIQNIMQEDERVSCIRHTENIGLPAISEFEAYRKARGTYIAFIFDDNEWEQDALAQLVKYAEKNHVKALAGQYKLFGGTPGASYDNPANWTVLGGSHVNVCNLMITNSFANGAVLLHRDTVETVGFLDPNIALSRLWDWDLWQRIARVFQFEMLDIMVGKEKGTGLADSLGNTHQLYQWAAQERMHQPRNKELLPDNYLECDIFEFSHLSSPFLYRSNCWVAKQYEKKAWFDANDPSLFSIKDKSGQPWSGKRIAFLTASNQVNASSTINWGRLTYSEEYVMFYSSLHYFDYYNWILADAIIIERDTSTATDTVLKWAKEMGIACYYYIDDNFAVLAKDYENTVLQENMQKLAETSTIERVNKFDGVFCSTNALSDYFLREGLHKNIAIMEPILESDQLQPFHALTETVNIAFFGSFIRGEILEKVVFPALLRISEKRSIHLYCPEETFVKLLKLSKESMGERKRLKYKALRVKNLTETDAADKGKKRNQESVCINSRFTVSSFPRTLSLDLALQRLASKNIQIQLHCGPIIENNAYKTANALLNAVCLGAALIATDDAPYSTIQSDRPVCVLARNTVEDWEAALNKLLDEKIHKEIYENALVYCRKKFNVTLGVNSVVEAMRNVTPYSMIDLNKRLLSYLQYANSIIGSLSCAIAAPTAQTTQVGGFPITVFLNTLSCRQLVRAIRAEIPSWNKSDMGLFGLLPPSLSSPIVHGQYVESRVLGISNTITIIVVASAPTHALFEFVAGDRIVSQQFLQVNTLSAVSLVRPKEKGMLRLRVANHSANGGMLYVLQRGLFSRTLFNFINVGSEV